ncbi:MAG: universal stress protein [Polyangiaceae bacterium]|nr:universal stress protein [Polyangiaceae bacterium]
MTGPIMIPLQGPADAAVALPIARRLAELEGVPIHVIHVAHEAATSLDVVERLGMTAIELRGSVLDTRAGEAGPAIVATADELAAGSIVMCTRTPGLGAAEPVGVTALEVLRSSPCPVFFLAPRPAIDNWGPRRILLPHDGTPATSAAVRPAADLARRSSADLDILHVASPESQGPVERGGFAPPRYMDQPQHEWPAWTGEFIERLGCICDLASLRVRMSFASGTPGMEVLRFADTNATDLIVLGWRGEWGGGHAATIKAIVGRTTLPVMVVRAPAVS